MNRLSDNVGDLGRYIGAATWSGLQDSEQMQCFQSLTQSGSADTQRASEVSFGRQPSSCAPSLPSAINALKLSMIFEGPFASEDSRAMPRSSKRVPLVNSALARLIVTL